MAQIVDLSSARFKACLWETTLMKVLFTSPPAVSAILSGTRWRKKSHLCRDHVKHQDSPSNIRFYQRLFKSAIEKHSSTMLHLWLACVGFSARTCHLHSIFPSCRHRPASLTVSNILYQSNENLAYINTSLFRMHIQLLTEGTVLFVTAFDDNPHENNKF